jgi:hypothetical protein
MEFPPFPLDIRISNDNTYTKCINKWKKPAHMHTLSINSLSTVFTVNLNVRCSILLSGSLLQITTVPPKDVLKEALNTIIIPPNHPPKDDVLLSENTHKLNIIRKIEYSTLFH